MTLMLMSMLSQEPPCTTVWRDSSSSMAEEEFRAVAADFVGFIRKTDGTINCVKVIRFSGAGERIGMQTGKIFRFDYRPPPPETPAERKKPESLAVRLRLKGALSVAEEEAASKARKARYEAETMHAAAVKAEADRLAEYLAVIPQRPARCTPFRVLAKRIATEDSPIAIAFTDGWTDCNDVVTLGEPSKGIVLVVLIPRSEDDAANEDLIFEERRKQMLKLFPAAIVIQPYLLEQTLTKIYARQ